MIAPYSLDLSPSTGELHDAVPAVRLTRIFFRRTVAAACATLDAVVHDVPARTVGPLELDGLHEPTASFFAISGNAVDMARPEALRTVVAKPAGSQRLDLTTADETRERLVTAGKEILSPGVFFREFAGS